MEGHYCWWHEQVLKYVAEAIYRAMANSNHDFHRRNITFVRVGKQPHPLPKLAAGSASDREFQVDLER